MSIKITETGTAEYPYLTTPDYQFSSGGKYQVKLVVPKEKAKTDIELINNVIASRVAKECQNKSGDQIKKAPLPYEERGEEIIFNFKMKASGVRKSDNKPFTQEPNLLNADLTPFDKDQKIWGGSKLKITFEPYAWNMPIGIGCTLRLKTVQVLELVTGKSTNSLGELKVEPVVAPKVKDEVEALI